MRIYDQNEPPGLPEPERKGSWMAQGEPSRWTRLRWVIAIGVVGFFLAMLALALTDEGNAAGTNGFKAKATGAIESFLGTDMVRGHTTGFFVDKGDVIDVNGVRIRVETTSLGEIGFWKGSEISKGTYCANGTNTRCRFGVWWGKFKGVQDNPGNIPSNTEYLKVRLRCNYQRECSQHDRTWGRLDPEPREDPFDPGWTPVPTEPSAEQPN